MDDLFSAAAEVERVCKEERLSFCFIGGIAVIRWGIPRVTRDLDVAVLAGFGGEAPVVQALLRHFQPRIADASAFAMESRVLLIRTHSGIEIDASLAALPFEEEMLRRASVFALTKEVQITTCSAEDLIVMKAFASRPRDWSDVESVLKRQTRIDWDYVDATLAPLLELKPDEAIAQNLQSLRHAVSPP